MDKANLNNLKELLNHPGWQDYLNLCETAMEQAFVEMLNLQPTSPDSTIKIVALKSKIDALRDMTYIIEHTLTASEEQVQVNVRFQTRFNRLLKKLWRIK